MTIRVIHGDCRDVLKTLPDRSVQMCVTSPPYYGLRDYNVDGQIGLEQSPDAYVAELVAVFRDVRRVLRDDATLWLNLGDSFANLGGHTSQGKISGRAGRSNVGAQNAVHGFRGGGDIKTKDLIGIPWMVAFALRADGWWLRSDIIWAKKNCMPESVTSRPSSAHEHVFLLAKSAKYYFDAEAIREEGVIPAGTRAAKGSNVRSELKDVNGRPPEYWEYTGTRNSRNVWWIATQPFAAAHFATFPPELAERCIKAGSSERGCCPACGAPWIRQIARSTSLESGSGKSGRKPAGKGAGGEQTESGTYDIRMGPVVSTTTVGWAPTCLCCAGEAVPCTIIDPFGGAGTSGLVADRLGRDAILIELSEEYCDITRRRLTKDAGMFAELTD